jgi:chromosome segregation ATPase
MDYLRALLPELEERKEEARKERARAEAEFKEAERKLRERDNALDYAYRQEAEAFRRSQQVPRELGTLKAAGPGQR